MTQKTTDAEPEPMTVNELFGLAAEYLKLVPEGIERTRVALMIDIARTAYAYRAYRQLADATELHRYNGLRIKVTGALVKSLYSDMGQQEVAALIREGDAFVVDLQELATLFTMARHNARAEATQREPSQ
jgi:hypothetical protein